MSIDKEDQQNPRSGNQAQRSSLSPNDISPIQTNLPRRMQRRLRYEAQKQQNQPGHSQAFKVQSEQSTYNQEKQQKPINAWDPVENQSEDRT